MKFQFGKEMPAGYKEECALQSAAVEYGWSAVGVNSCI